MNHPMSTTRDPAQRRLSAEVIVLVLICIAYMGWVLSLPLFPTQDGPVHLYYVHVMQALLSQQPTPYSSFYSIKHLLPPYSLYYYSLIALAKFLPILVADKVVICCYFVSFVFGFRYLATQIGPSADRMTLLATLFLLNWPLGMGFVNFCLSVTFALWATGLWVRSIGGSGYRRRGWFLLLTIIITLTHPVPLLFVLAFCGVSLAFRLFQHRRQQTASALPSYFKTDIVVFLLAGSVLGYVKLFTSSKLLHQTSKATSTLAAFVHHIIPLGFVAGDDWWFKIYAYLLWAILVLSFLLAIIQWVRRRPEQTTSFSTLWLLLAIGFLAILPLIPHDLNGSHFFADRLTIFAWLLALLAASTYKPQWRFERRALITFVVLSNLFILGLAERYTRPPAIAIASIQTAPVAHRGDIGLALQDHIDPDYDPKIHLASNPYLWAFVHYFRYNDAILYNTPWLDLEIIPLGAKGVLTSTALSPTAMEAPWTLAPELLGSPAERTAVLSSVRFAMVDVQKPDLPIGLPNTLAQKPPAYHWTCTPGQASWYIVCDR